MHAARLRRPLIALALGSALLAAGCTDDAALDASKKDAAENQATGTDASTTSTTSPALDLPVTEHESADHHVTELNGEVPPGEATFAKEQETVLRAGDGRGHESLVHRTVRAPGTRAPIHIHGYGGTTCVIEGEMTLLMEGSEPNTVPAGGCYYMPPDVHMSGFNTGDVDAVMLDIFVVPEGEPDWVNLETE